LIYLAFNILIITFVYHLVLTFLFVIIIFCVRAHVSGCSQPFVSRSVQFTVILYLLFAFLFPNKLSILYNINVSNQKTG